nr:uncharacterized protein LOC116776101 [Danaus plexippus plexippus]
MAVYDFRNFSSSKFVDDFGREFKKHEVLWQSYFLMDPNQIQFAKNKAYKCIAYKLDLTVDRVIELLKDFPNVCFDMLKQTFTKKYNTSGSSVSDGPRQQLPKWLLYLMMKSDMFEKLKQNEQLNTVTTSNEPDVLIQELLTSVELSLEGSYGKKIQRLKGPCAVKYFAKKYGVRVADVLSVWQGIYNLCLLKLKALLNLSSRLHDVPGTLRLNHQEWKVTDLILLYKHDLKLINLSNFSTGRKHSSLILLYKLMVAARSYYQQEIHVDNRDDARDENNERDECDDEADKDTAAVLKDLNRNNAGKSSQEAMDEGENNEITQRTEQANAAVAENEKDELESNSCKDVPALVLKVEGIDENNWYGRAVEQKVVWALVYTGFINRGRSASIIYLQRRWLELVHLARNTILNVWNSEDKDVKVHPLLPLLVNRFPEIITDYLPPWRQIVRERLYVMESDIEDLLIECLQNEKLNLDINEDLSDSDFIKEFYENELSCLNTNDKMYTENLEVTDILEKIDPSKAKVTIKFEDSDDGDMCGDSVYGEVNFDCSGEDSQYVNQYDDMSLDLIDNIDRDIKEEYDLMDNTDSMGTSVTGDAVRAYNENNSTDDVFIKSEDQIKSEAEDNIWQEAEISPEEVKREGSPDIDEKLIKESHVVLTPVDNFNEWKKYSRDGTISCRRFSIKNFSKLIVIDSKQLRKCRRYVNKDNTKEINRYFNCRIKYENVDNAEDVRSETIAGEKVKELNAMPYIARKNRIELTKKLKLSRTYYTSGFWCNERNIERLRQCRPMHVKLCPSRIPKKVELSDINEVRKINSMLQTARVSPTPAAVDNVSCVVSHNNEKSEASAVPKDDDDDDSEPNLVIDESVKETKDDEKEECRKDNNKNVRDNTKTRADGKHKNNRKKKRIEKPNDEEKPLHDEYQEWQRQKTMNLKYFTLPNNSQTTDKPSKDSGDKDKKKSKTAGSLKNKTIGTNTDNVAQTESVVLISDSDSDVQIVDSDGTNPPTNKQGINQPINLDLDRISKDSKQFVK